VKQECTPLAILNQNIPHRVGRISEHCLRMKFQSEGHSTKEHGWSNSFQSQNI